MENGTEPTNGLKARTNKSGVKTAYWVAANCSRKAKHYPRPVVRLHGPEATWGEACRALREDLLLWIAEQAEPARPLRFDGTWGGLIDQYTGHEMSPYHNVKASTKARYDWELKAIRLAVGRRLLSKTTGIDLMRWERNFGAPNPGSEKRKVARAHDLMSSVRKITSWGKVLELPHCARLHAILEELEFEGVAGRTALFTYDHAKAVIDRAHAVGRPSVALAQALQFDTMLRQIDVIGEWVVDLASTSGIRNRVKNARSPKRWETGLTWGHIDHEMILRKLVSKTARKTRAIAEIDLKKYPMTMAELGRVAPDRRMGPVVINEETGLPYTYGTFYDVWRSIANEAGVPPQVQNRDSRSGGITEGTDAGATLEMVRHTATHKNPATTARYSRSTLTKTGEVADMRMRHRQSNEKK